VKKDLFGNVKDYQELGGMKGSIVGPVTPPHNPPSDLLYEVNLLFIHKF